mgnify:FL=1|tara:strand:+ start:19375 stop:19782 length:408 start_codon:yes stop_codon:yes gene_type:complete
MHVIIQPSPTFTHKLRVTLPNKRSIDFGEKGVQHYTEHGNSRIMRAQLLKKGAIIPKELRIERDQYEIHRGMLQIKESSKEDWEDYFRADFWERWLLYTYPNVIKAKLYLTLSQGIIFLPRPEDLCVCQDHIIDQ